MDIETLNNIADELTKILSETVVSKFAKVSDCKYQRQGIITCIKKVEEIINQQKEQKVESKKVYYIIYINDFFIESYSIKDNSITFTTTYDEKKACRAFNFDDVKKFLRLNFKYKEIEV